MKTLTKTMDGRLMIQKVKLGIEGINTLFQERKRVITGKPEFKSLKPELQKEFKALKFSRTETRITDGLEVLCFYFKKRGAEYVFGIGKNYDTNTIQEDYVSFGLNAVNPTEKFYQFPLQDHLHHEIKEFAIELINDVDYKFGTEEKRKEYKNKLELQKV